MIAGNSQVQLAEMQFGGARQTYSGHPRNGAVAMTAGKEDRENNSCSKIISKFGRSTTIHGLPNIISTKTLVGKLAWAILFLSAVGVLALQASELIRLFLDYDVRVKMEIGTAKSLPFPAVTLCNTNMVRQSAIEASEHALLARTDPKHPDSVHKLLSYTGPCLPGDFMCGDGVRCIKPHLKCDGYFHCWDRETSDEFNCTYPPCGQDEFECDKPGIYGRCIHESKRCDGFLHCLDGEDEKHCPMCSLDVHSCDFGIDSSGWRCVPATSLCDHYPDCKDGSDETRSCVYGDNYVEGVCIPQFLESRDGPQLFYSSRYPSQYPPNEHCLYTIRAPTRYCVAIQFLEVEIGTSGGDCNDSYVELTDNSNPRYTARYCGMQTPPPWTSIANLVQVVFVSDDKSQGRGFRIEYFNTACPATTYWVVREPWSECSATCGGGTRHRVIEATTRDLPSIPSDNSTNDPNPSFIGRRSRVTATRAPADVYIMGFEPHSEETCNVVYCSEEDYCGVTLTECCRFELASPGYPKYYSENLECVIDINNDVGCIDIEILDIDIAESYGCYADYLQVEDLGDPYGGELTHRFCGEVPGKRWRSFSGEVRLTFHSDSDPSVPGKGYRAVYEFVSCGSWHVSHWSQCSVDCGVGAKFRQVLCRSRVGNKEISDRHCPGKKPQLEDKCHPQNCDTNGLLPPDVVPESLWATYKHISDDLAVYEQFVDVYYKANHFDRVSSEVPPDWKGFLTYSSSPDYSDVKRVLKLTKEEMSKYGHQGEDFILQCSFNDVYCNSSDFWVFQSDYYGNCFTFNHGKEGAPIRQSTRSGAQYGLKLTLFIEQDEYIPLYGTQAGVRVLIHPPDITPFPEDNGVTVPPGIQTSIGVRRDTIKGRGWPYTNCTDQQDMDSIFGDEYSYSDLACHKNQIERYIARECGCVDTVHMNGSRCMITSQAQEVCRQLMEFFYQQGLLSHECREPCSKIHYDETMSHAQWPSDKHVGGLINVLRPINDKMKATVVDEESARDNLVRLEVYYRELNYQKISEVPAYTVEELFGDLGGLLGLYIGLSVMTAAEFLELFLIAMRFACSKIRRAIF